MPINHQHNKDFTIKLLRSTGRKGMDKVIEKLEELGFFTAPASTFFHLNEPGGLALHSLYVYEMARRIKPELVALRPTVAERLDDHSIIIAALLHDVCKAEIYKPTIKRMKQPDGRWIDTPGYDVDYTGFPMGHGEKSVIRLLQWGLEMTDDEIIAIRWHMQAWDLAFQSYEAKESLNKASEKCPLLKLIQAADGLAAGVLEV